MTTKTHQKFVESCKAWKTSAIAVQKESHNLLKQAASWYFQHSFDTTRIAMLLNIMNEVPGFRIEAVKAYSSEFLGVTITEEKDKSMTVKRNRKAEVDGSTAMEQVRATPWYIWAPKETPLKVPKFSMSWTVQMARAVAIGTETEESLLENFSRSKVDEIVKLSRESKAMKWAEEYFDQNPPKEAKVEETIEAEAEVDSIDQELKDEFLEANILSTPPEATPTAVTVQ